MIQKKKNRYRKSSRQQNCKTFRFLIIREFTKRYYKFLKMEKSGSEASDTRVNNVFDLGQKPGTEAMTIITSKLQEL